MGQKLVNLVKDNLVKEKAWESAGLVQEAGKLFHAALENANKRTVGRQPRPEPQADALIDSISTMRN